VRRRETGNAQVGRVAAVADRDAAVLWSALLGDVELGHDLEAARHGGLLRLRNRGEAAHDAVDPRTHEHVLGLRLEVEVGRLLIERARDQRVHELDRR